MPRGRLGCLVATLLSGALIAGACSSKSSTSTTATTASGSSTTTGCATGVRSGPATAQLVACKTGGVFRLGITEPTAIDPANSQESEGQNVTKNLFDGLVRVDSKTAQLLPDVATTWDKNADCTMWTFHLGSSKFSSGEAVTAQSFIDGMNRAAQKAAASDTATFMADVAGFDAVNGGTATTMSGLSAPDPATLVVALAKANCEFDKVTVQPVYLPVPKGTTPFDSKNTTAYSDQPIGNGPFMMKGPWQHKTSITLVANPNYAGPTPPHLAEVDFTILPDASGISDEYKGFQAGTFDYSRIPTELLGQAKSTYDSQSEFLHQLTYGINYLGVQIKSAPFGPGSSEQARHARLAVSYAIDRKSITSGVFNGFETPAIAIIPPPFKDFYLSDGSACPECTFDVTKAKAEAQMGGLTPGTAISLEFNTGAGHEAWTSAVCDQLKTNLGVTCTPNGTSFKQLLVDEKAPNGTGLFRAAWSADYPSPIDFLKPLMGTGSGDNRGLYSNPDFDKLLAQAEAAPNNADRIKLVQQAEQLGIGHDVGLIPLWYRDQYRLANSKKFKGIGIDFFENPTLSQISLA
ncbi:MAG: peptide ABC transporter substrate-binding protein [Actinomycetota bacterium]|nr:peptide ABC transporter substrate-binding protein [Actinomycetota bacterium]